MATLYKHDGTTKTVEPENGKNFRLPELYRLLECNIVEVIYPPKKGTIMVIDEEGKLRDDFQARYNRDATKIMGANLFPGDFVTGTALLCKSSELK